MISSVIVLSKKWFDELPVDLQNILRADAASVSTQIVSFTTDFFAAQRLNKFAKATGLISETVPYDRLVAIQFRELWKAD